MIAPAPRAARAIAAALGLLAFFAPEAAHAGPGREVRGPMESRDEFTCTFFVGVPEVSTLPLLTFNASNGRNYQTASITALSSGKVDA